MSLPSLLKFSVVPINKIHRRCCRDCRRDRNFSISATLVAAVVLVATIAEEYVSIYRHCRRNTFFDDSGDSSDGSDYMETGLKEARKGFFGCYSVCETMKDTKEGYFIM